MKTLSSITLLAAFLVCFTSCKKEASLETGQASTENAIKSKVNSGKTNQLSAANSVTGEKLPITIAVAENLSHNFGTVKEGEKPTTTFKIKNEGEIDLILNQAKPSCGCTAPNAPLNQPFKPGETAEITVQYDSNNRVGAINKTVTVYGNFEKPIILTILGEVVDVS